MSSNQTIRLLVENEFKDLKPVWRSLNLNWLNTNLNLDRRGKTSFLTTVKDTSLRKSNNKSKTNPKSC